MHPSSQISRTKSFQILIPYLGYSLYYDLDLAANSQEKTAIRKVVARITDYLIAHNYDLIDLDGKPTRWGLWSESYFQTEDVPRMMEPAFCCLTGWDVTMAG